MATDCEIPKDHRDIQTNKRSKINENRPNLRNPTSNTNNIHNNTKKNKLSHWMKKFIQPTKDINNINSNHKKTRQKPQANISYRHNETKTISSSLRPIVTKSSKNDLQSVESTKFLQWDNEPDRVTTKSSVIIQDNASIAPLISFCSSSVKSSTFSDIHSIQSTKPTVMSIRTLETNSSIMAIPPASILDRGRQNLINGSNNSICNTSMSATATSSKYMPLQRHNSSHTITSIMTIKS
ncbi:hypothetical protein KAFR_0A03310 [Kazachstania africana CBS 2517]|uniref:Uncharacterized protein n=1 Tax=Kazachstania africana (strain ATCC 22294 / BCRC 22015 / CBS 2517 / CECT 1963 / NBRC 1671 / NRRL Y-8276) TaxID=1071382 RepID=H2AN16_KAZAF|nr:hypothetical protein KAFR_0A03310 [Kazachstania africana CBS 2517]CCF55766.1 hypothetical protein KAFR_0A03310 [Kazachstania africana CBS 2517]